MSGGTGYGSLDLHQELPDIFTGKKKKKPSKVKGSGRFRRGQKSIQILKPLQQIIDESPYNHKTHPDGLTIYHKSSANPEERYSKKNRLPVINTTTIYFSLIRFITLKDSY